MSIERSFSSGSRHAPALPPSLHLAIPQEHRASPDRRESPKLTVKKFSKALHHIIFSKRLSSVDRLEKVSEATAEDEDAEVEVEVEYPSVSSHSTKHKRHGTPASPRPSMGSIVSQSTSSHFSAPQHPPQTLITSFPSLNVADIPSRSPTNKSPFSAVLLSGEGEEYEEVDPAVAVWHTEQVHRARLAKLTRHLGEEIPADMVLSPTLLSRGASSHHSLRPRRGERGHQRRRSLDPSAFLQDLSVSDPRGGNLRRSRSLKEHEDAIPPLPTNFPDEYTADSRGTEKGDCSTDASIDPEAARAPPDPDVTSPSPENRPKLPQNSLDETSSRDRISMETRSDSLASPSTRPSVETYSSETSHPSPRPSPRIPSKSRTLPRRPATADAGRRVEKLANFFGVDRDDLSAVAHLHGAAQRLQFSASAAGDLAIGIHTTNPQLEVDVKITKPSRFWNLIDGRVTTKPVHPDDVMKKLRTMKAS